MPRRIWLTRSIMPRLVVPVLLIGMTLFISPAWSQGPVPPSAEKVRQLVEQLQSPRFVEREEAMRGLIAAGDSSIEPLVKALPAGGQEVVARGMVVLSELALSDDAIASKHSWLAIETLAEQSEGPLLRRASDSLTSLHALRKQRARDILVKHGARVSDRRDQIGNVIVSVVYSIEIPAEFNGGIEAIQQIRWLDDTRQVSMYGDQVTDEWLVPLAELKELIAVEVKRSKVTDKGIGHLAGLPNLQYLSLYYSPVTDDSVKTIGSIKPLSEIRLFGTEITPDGAEELVRSLPLANVDHRHGAFLGVGCQTHPDGAQISIMHDGSAADLAGMRSGDVIQTFDGKKVADFDELKAAIAEHRSGGKVVIKALRADQPLEFEVKLGEWE